MPLLRYQPHNGILEAHNVDKGLEGKLKCRIFIPSPPNFIAIGRQVLKKQVSAQMFNNNCFNNSLGATLIPWGNAEMMLYRQNIYNPGNHSLKSIVMVIKATPWKKI